MVRRRDPLVPPALFRIRAFAVINASTFLIYGALYTYSFLVTVFLQGVLGYTALASAAVGLPVGILLTLFSTRVGTVVGAYRAVSLPGHRAVVDGRRSGLAVAHLASTSAPWLLGAGSGAMWPPTDVLWTCCRRSSCSASASRLVVAPLTTTLMGSCRSPTQASARPSTTPSRGSAHHCCWRCCTSSSRPCSTARWAGWCPRWTPSRMRYGRPSSHSIRRLPARIRDRRRHRPGIHRRVPDRDAGRLRAARWRARRVNGLGLRRKPGQRRSDARR